MSRLPVFSEAVANFFRLCERDHKMMAEALDELDPFITAPEYIICDGCDRFVELGADGFDAGHVCRGNA